jgi:hypothetical protein
VLLGVILVVSPGDGAIGITWAIGWLAFLFGTAELWLAARGSGTRPTSCNRARASGLATPERAVG